MKANLALVQNISDNISNEDWDAVWADVCLIDSLRGCLKRIRRAMTADGPNSEEDVRWIKAVGPMLAGEYACGNI